MTSLQRRALATVAMSAEEVSAIYIRATAADTRRLAMSHERLRMELQGAEILLAEYEDEIINAIDRISCAIALNDTKALQECCNRLLNIRSRAGEATVAILADTNR
jgi:hypothetical protein